MRRSSGNTVRRGVLVVLAIALSIPSFAQQAELDATKTVSGGRPQRTVLVSIPDRRLAVLEDGEVIAEYAVAVGAPVSPSPSGTFQVVNRVTNPTYYHEGIVIPTGKDNPVGTRWIGLDLKGYGIHGTNAPRSIGHAASHGCIRLRNRDVEKLFVMLEVGDAVEIHGERDDATAEIFGGEADDSIVAGNENIASEGQ